MTSLVTARASWRKRLLQLALLAVLPACEDALPPADAPNVDLTIDKTASATSINVGDTVTFTVTVTNNGPLAATTVLSGDTMPTGLTFASATTSQGTLALNGVWTIGDLAVAGSATMTIKATGSATATANTVWNRAGVLSSDFNDSILTNNIDSISVTVNPTVTPPPPPPPGAGEPTYNAAVDQMVIQDNFDAFATIDARHAELLRLRSTQGNNHTPFVSDNRQTDNPGAGFQSTHLVVSPGRGGAGRALRSVYPAVAGNTASTWITWPAAQKYPIDTSVVVFEVYFRVASVGWEINFPGGKWFEFWHPGNTTRTQVALEGGNERWHVNPASQGNFAYQPQGTPRWQVFNQGNWHRMLIMYRPANVTGDQRGIVRMWIDGQKIIDMSASGITAGFATVNDVSKITTGAVWFLKWPDVLNSNDGQMVGILEFDDLRWWIELGP